MKLHEFTDRLYAMGGIEQTGKRSKRSRRLNESLAENFADTSRVTDIVRYCYSKDILDLDRIEKIVRNQMTKEGSIIPDNLEECILETLDDLFGEEDEFDDYYESLTEARNSKIGRKLNEDTSSEEKAESFINSCIRHDTEINTGYKEAMLQKAYQQLDKYGVDNLNPHVYPVLISHLVTELVNDGKDVRLILENSGIDYINYYNRVEPTVALTKYLLKFNKDFNESLNESIKIANEVNLNESLSYDFFEKPCSMLHDKLNEDAYDFIDTDPLVQSILKKYPYAFKIPKDERLIIKKEVEKRANEIIDKYRKRITKAFVEQASDYIFGSLNFHELNVTESLYRNNKVEK